MTRHDYAGSLLGLAARSWIETPKHSLPCRSGPAGSAPALPASPPALPVDRLACLVGVLNESHGLPYQVCTLYNAVKKHT